MAEIETHLGNYKRAEKEVGGYGLPGGLEVSEPMKVMSFNINGQPDWYPDEPVKQWQTRAMLVRRIFNDHTPDVAGIQEAGLRFWWDSFRDGDHPFKRLRGEEAGDININDIVYSEDSIEIAGNTGTFWLTPDGNYGKAWEGAERGTSFAQFKHRKIGEFSLFNVHLDNVSTLARQKGMEIVLKKADEIAENKPVIMLGDLNTATAAQPGNEDYFMPDSATDFSLTDSVMSDERMFDLVDRAGFINAAPDSRPRDSGSETTFHGWKGQSADQEPDKFGVRHPDHIFYRDAQNEAKISRGLAVAGFKIIRDHLVLPDGSVVWPSDHYPVVATITSSSPA